VQRGAEITVRLRKNDPFLSFRSLSPNVDDTVDEAVSDKNDLVDSCSLRMGPDNVFIICDEVSVSEAVNTVEIAVVGLVRQ
jgi:hypothetical protein